MGSLTFAECERLFAEDSFLCLMLTCPYAFSLVARWEEPAVTAWLQTLRLGSHSSTFARNDITGAVLLDVDQSALKDMGISSVGDRIRIFTAIKNLRKKCIEADNLTRNRLSQAQRSDVEYTNSYSSRMAAGDASNKRRSMSTRPPPLHLSQSAQDMPLTPTHNSPQQIYANSQGLGLREARALVSNGQNNRAGKNDGSSAHRSPSSTNRRLMEGEIDIIGHRKMNSIGAPSPALLAQQQQQQRLIQQQQILNSESRTSNAVKRPSTGYIESGRIGPGSNTNSPTNATFQRPSTADGGAARLLAPANGIPLTPITEASSSSSTGSNRLPSSSHTTSSYPVSRNGQQLHPRPITPGQVHTVTTPLSAYPTDLSRNTALSLEDVKRRTIKFIGEDGATRIISVSDCRDAFDVLARVLKKFGKPATGNSYTPTAGQSTIDDDVVTIQDASGDQWGIFATSGEGQTKYLTDNELLAICHAPQPHDPLRERGLTIRRVNRAEEQPSSGKRSIGKRSKLEYIFGEDPQKKNYLSPNKSSNQYNLDDGLLDAAQVNAAGKKMNRASTISILSGLGTPPVSGGNRGNARSPLYESRDNQQRSPSGGAGGNIPRKARNFFGQRPPSELISSHLADYFPSTEKRVLERTARKSIYGRPTTSIRSKRDSSWSYAADLEGAPPLPRKGSGDANAMHRLQQNAPSILIGMQSSDDLNNARQGDDTLAPVMSKASLAGWSEITQSGSSSHLPTPGSRLHSGIRPVSMRRISGESQNSRKSLATQLRNARGIGGVSQDNLAPSTRSNRGSMIGGIAGDRSDTASMLTVDEITQEVESRRESMYNIANAGGGWVVDEDGVPIPVPTSGRSKQSPSRGASSRASSALSLRLDDSKSDDDNDDNNDKGSMIHRERSPNANAPGDETDQHLGDPMAKKRNATSRASVVSQLQSEDDGEDESEGDYGDGSSEEDEDDKDDDDDDGAEGGGVYQSAASGKEPIKWIKGALIGAGSFGNVFLGMNAKNGLLMAVKQVELPSGDSHNDQRKKSMLEALEREIELLKTMQHENIVQYLDSYADGTHLNIFLEYVPGGSVVALLRNYGAFEEPLVRNFVKQILHGLNYLHNRDIVHRDIKGANILVDNKSCIKISDFGISKKVESDLLISARAHRPSLQGSVFWMAPEVVKQTSYTRKADIWSLGCLIVEMISGSHPWANLNQMQALFKIGSMAKPQIPEDISLEAIDFLNKTFEIDHNSRPSAEELLQHAFITEEFSLGVAPSRSDSLGAKGNATTTSSGNGTSPLLHRNHSDLGEEAISGSNNGKNRSKGGITKKHREINVDMEGKEEE